MEPDREALRDALLAWYRSRKRDLPFRRTRDPYAILVAETILQRTRVGAGVSYYERFVSEFPTVSALAASREEKVLRVWEGLGFYGRARNLHRAAKAIVERHDGRVPARLDELSQLPGVGEYTAGAVASIAFGVRAPAVDGNVRRVLARLFRVEENPSLGTGRRRIYDLARELVPTEGPGEWNQALMELGATICVPRVPRCPACPLRGECVAFAAGVQNELPRSSAKREVPSVRIVFVTAWDGGKVLVVHRQSGLHAGLYALPGGEVKAGESDEEATGRHLADLGVQPHGLEQIGPIRHVFSHMRWEGVAFTCRIEGLPQGGRLVPLRRLANTPLVPFHRKLIARSAPSRHSSSRNP